MTVGSLLYSRSVPRLIESPIRGLPCLFATTIALSVLLTSLAVRQLHAQNNPYIRVTTSVTGLTIPWDLAFTPDGTMLFTQRGGVLSSRLPNGTVRTVTADFSDLFVERETGLMAIVVDPDFASNRRFYTCQGHTGPEV